MSVTELPIDPDPEQHGSKTRVVCGAGSLAKLGELVAELGVSRVLIVTGSALIEAGHVARAEASLSAAGISFARFDRVHDNPNSDHVDECVVALRAVRPDALIGLGGGSAIDTAKGANFVYTNGGTMEDYWGIGKATKPMLPLVAVPTTAGTGSEMQSFALIERARDHQKMACGDERAAPRIALLDPELTFSQPHSVTACTGLDALGHALETAVTRKRTSTSILFSRRAFQLCVGNLESVLAQPGDIEARGALLLAAAFAGFAIENSMLGAAHSLANPLTAHYGIAHGQAVGMMLPYVVRFNASEADARAEYAALARSGGLCEQGATEEAAVESLVGRVARVLDAAGIPRSLEACGVERADVSRLAQEAAQQWTAKFNPRTVVQADFEALLQAALAGSVHA